MFMQKSNGQKNVGSKNVGSKKFWSEKIDVFFQLLFLVVDQKHFGLKNCCVQKNCGPKILRPKKFG